MAGSPPCFQLRSSNPWFGWAVLGARGPLGVQGEAGDALAEASFPFPSSSPPSASIVPQARSLFRPIPFSSPLVDPAQSPAGSPFPSSSFPCSSFCFLPTFMTFHWMHGLSPGVLDTGRPSSSTLLLNSYNQFGSFSIALLLRVRSLFPGLPPS